MAGATDGRTTTQPICLLFDMMWRGIYMLRESKSMGTITAYTLCRHSGRGVLGVWNEMGIIFCLSNRAGFLFLVYQ